MEIINTLLPILIIILLGTVLRKIKFVNDFFFQKVNKLVFYISLPCLLFSKTAQFSLEGDAAIRISLVLFFCMLSCLVLGYFMGWILKIPRVSLGTFVQGAYRGNLVYVGLPIVFFSFSNSPGDNIGAIETLAIISIVPIMISYNIAAVLVLQGKREKKGERVASYLLALCRNPIILSCMAGYLYSLSGFKLPPMILRSCSTVGQMALPLALLGIGTMLRFESLRKNLIPSLVAACIKVILSPAIGYLLCTLFSLNSIEIKISLIFCTCPTAILSFVMAQQMDGDEKMSIGIIVFSTFLFFFSCGIILSIL
jgi:predicted permease